MFFNEIVYIVCTVFLSPLFLMNGIKILRIINTLINKVLRIKIKCRYSLCTMIIKLLRRIKDHEQNSIKPYHIYDLN